jgi:hypothetical protein
MLIDISSANLRKMVKLSERKEALMSQIQETGSANGLAPTANPRRI